jgi:sulfite reductase beta subunit-like hemoprotein
MLHDLGVIATMQGGRQGFKLVAGGGLGHKPRPAIVVDPFVPEAALLAAMEAVITLHDKHSDRTKRAKSRAKFLVERFGEAGFVARYREEFARSREALAATPGPIGDWRTPQDVPVPGPGAPRAVFLQRQPGLFAVPISVPLGHVESGQWLGLGALLRSSTCTARFPTTRMPRSRLCSTAARPLRRRRGMRLHARLRKSAHRCTPVDPWAASILSAQVPARPIC